jgi:hypothetical protein
MRTIESHVTAASGAVQFHPPLAAPEAAAAVGIRARRVLGATVFVLLLLVTSVGAGSVGAAPEAGTPVRVVISDTKVTLSPTAVPAGRVVFTISNVGKRARRFRIAGRQTPALGRGVHATLNVDLARPGSYPFSAVGPSGANGRLTGSLHVVGAAAPKASTAPATQQPAASFTGSPCTSPSTTTVNVTMTDVLGPGFTFSPPTFPCGTVTFVITNLGQSAHVLQVTRPDGGDFPASPVVDPNKTVSITLSLTVTGTYGWADGYGEGYETTYGKVAVQ